MNATVDRKACIGSASCASIAPAAFKLGDSIQGEVVDPESVGLLTLLEAAENCPTGAITIWDEFGNRIYP